MESNTLAKSGPSAQSSTSKRRVRKEKPNFDEEVNQNRLKRQRPSTLQKQQAKKEKIKKRINKKEKSSSSEFDQQDTQSQSEQHKQNERKTKKTQKKHEKKQLKQNSNMKISQKIKQKKAEQIYQCSNVQNQKKVNSKLKVSDQQKEGSILKPQSKAKAQKVSKSKPKQKQESINEIMQQYAKISRKKKRKSNFYLDRQDSLRWGEPVGRGSKKQRQKLEQRQKIQRQRQKERKKKMKQMIAQLCRPFNKNAENKAKIQQVEMIEARKQTKNPNTNQQFCKTQEKIEAKLQNQKQGEFKECKVQESNKNYYKGHFSNAWINQNVQKDSIINIRSQLKGIFQKVINLVEIQNPEKIPFSQKQKALITRELLRQNKYNRLFRDNKFLAQAILKIMYSVNSKESQIDIITMKTDLQNIWNEFDKFINNVEAQQEGYSQSRLALCKTMDESEKLDAELFYACQFLSQLNDNTVLKQWSIDEQKTLAQLYIHFSVEQAQRSLNQKYKDSIKWQTQFQIQAKVNQLTLRGLAMLYDLTNPIVLGDQQNNTANMVQISLRQYLRMNRSCQLGIFSNYAELILKLMQFDKGSVHNVKKKLLSLYFKSTKNEISEAVKAINNFLKIEQLLVRQNSSNPPSMQYNKEKYQQESVCSDLKKQTNQDRNT